jgi:hypothetical protein
MVSFDCTGLAVMIPSRRRWEKGDEMARDGLFGDLPERPAAEAKGAGAPRLREPIRDQIELRPVDLDS